MPARLLLPLMLSAAACDTGSFLDPTDPDEPTNLVYQLIPSGDPNAPAGIVLQWEPPRSGLAVTYDVYSRSSSFDQFGLRATTTSPSFHDAGYPQLQYYVIALDVDQQELGALARQPRGDSLADAGRAAGDERALAGERLHDGGV